MKIKKIVTLTICLMALQSLAKEGSGSHGGDGLIINGKPYLLDLVEAGVENEPLYNSCIEVNESIHRVIKRSLPHLSLSTDKLIQKLSEIYAVSPRIGLALTYAFDFYDFRLVNPSLVNVPDEDTVIDYDPKNLVQLAIRKGAAILIDREQWSKLNTDHKAALLLHEIIYAFAKIEKIDKFVGFNNDGVALFEEKDGQASAPVRSLVGFFYSQGFIDGSYRARMSSLLMKSQLSQISSPVNDPIKSVIISPSSYIFSNQIYYDEYALSLEKRWVKIELNKNDEDIMSFCHSIGNLIYYNDFQLVPGYFSIKYNSQTSALHIGNESTPVIRSVEAKNPEACLKSYKDIQSKIPVGEKI